MGVPEFIPFSTWELGDKSINYFKTYCGFKRAVSGSSFNVYMEEVWNIKLQLLTAFKLKYGHCMVTQYHKENGVKLGTWLNTKCVLMKKRELDIGKQLQLEKLGDIQRHKEDGVNLGGWLKNQLMFMKKGEIHIGKQVQLEKLGVVWDNSHQWEIVFNLLVKHNADDGNCKVTQCHKVDGINLQGWLKNQRCSIEKDNLDNERTCRLLALVNILRKQM